MGCMRAVHHRHPSGGLLCAYSRVWLAASPCCICLACSSIAQAAVCTCAGVLCLPGALNRAPDPCKLRRDSEQSGTPPAALPPRSCALRRRQRGGRRDHPPGDRARVRPGPRAPAAAPGPLPAGGAAHQACPLLSNLTQRADIVSCSGLPCAAADPTSWAARQAGRDGACPVLSHLIRLLPGCN